MSKNLCSSCKSPDEAITNCHRNCLEKFETKIKQMSKDKQLKLLNIAVNLIIYPAVLSDDEPKVYEDYKNHHNIALYLVEKFNIQLTLIKNEDINFYTWMPMYAAATGNLELLKYAHENGCEWHKEITYAAARTGHLECLKYAHENGCPWSGHTTSGASLNGHLDCLKYAHENGAEWWCTDVNACVYGYLHCLKYAYENGCPRDKYTTYYAAENGHLECLKYLHESGCEWHPLTTYHAAKTGHLECLLYCLENECPIHPETLDKLFTYKNITNDDNSLFKKILSHPRMKKQNSELSSYISAIMNLKYPDFIGYIKNCKVYIVKNYLLSNRQLEIFH